MSYAHHGEERDLSYHLDTILSKNLLPVGKYDYPKNLCLREFSKIHFWVIYSKRRAERALHDGMLFVSNSALEGYENSKFLKLLSFPTNYRQKLEGPFSRKFTKVRITSSLALNPSHEKPQKSG
jgi:hypothetical protein